jgi:hypothetical protein
MKYTQCCMTFFAVRWVQAGVFGLRPPACIRWAKYGTQFLHRCVRTVCDSKDFAHMVLVYLWIHRVGVLTFHVSLSRTQSEVVLVFA